MLTRFNVSLTLSLHDALPISVRVRLLTRRRAVRVRAGNRPRSCQHQSGECRDDLRRPSHACPHRLTTMHSMEAPCRSEEHTSELQSQFQLVCRLLLEKKKKKI